MSLTSRLRKLENQTPVQETYFGRKWYVDAKTGSNSGSGRTPSSPFLTMAKAFTMLESGDIILVRGKVREQISTPAGVFDVQIIGAGNQPRHADDHTEDGNIRGSSSATWTTPASPTATTPLLTIQQQGWVIDGILFDGPADAAAVQIFRDAGADDAERDGSHCWIKNCKFVAAQNHVEFKGGLSQCVLENNLFFGSTADSILETVGAGVGTNNYHRFIGNHWQNNASHLDVALNFATIAYNTFGKQSAGSAGAIDTTGGSENMIYANAFYGTYSIAGGYKGVASDEWGGNWNSISGGLTAADPA